MDSSENRREAFRVDDLVGIEVRVLDEAQVQQLLASFDAHRLRRGLRTHISHYRDNQRALLKTIGIRQPEVASYLAHLEEQLSRLADQVSLGRAESESDTVVMSPVCLSASGMRFDSALALVKDQSLELVLTLMPGSHMIYVIAQVVRFEERERGPSRVSVRFERMHVEDEELLARHIVRVQQLDLQRRRRVG